MKIQILLILLLIVSIASPTLAITEDFEDDVVGNPPFDDWYTFWVGTTEPKCDYNVTNWTAISNNSWNISSQSHFEVTTETTNLYYNITEDMNSTYVNFSYYPYDLSNISRNHGYLKWQICADQDILTKRITDINIGYESHAAGEHDSIYYRTQGGTYIQTGWRYIYNQWNNISIKLNYTDETYNLGHNNGTGWQYINNINFRDSAAQTDFDTIYWFAPKTTLPSNFGENACNITIDNLYLSEEESEEEEDVESDYFNVWLTSDQHCPLADVDNSQWLDAVQDANDTFTYNISLCIGDIIDSHDAPYAAWTLEQKLKAWRNDTNESTHHREDFYCINGNHEPRMIMQDGTGEKWDWNEIIDPFGLNQSTSYVNNSNRTYPLIETSFENETQSHYSFRTGNVLYIMLSTNFTNISKNDYRASFDFWNSTVHNNTNVSIITCSHFMLSASGLTIPTNPILPNSDEFETVLTDTANHTVVAWFSGHVHYGAGDSRYNYNSTLNCTFTCISSIDAATSGGHSGTERHSYIMSFHNDSIGVNLSDYNHGDNVWDPFGNPGNISNAFNLSFPFDLFWAPAEGPENQAPVVSNPNITNNSEGVSIDTTLLNVTIEDPDGDTFNWTIETQPDIGTNNSNDNNNGSKNCSISGLTCNTTYTWYINVTDGVNETNISYNFKTEDCPGQFNNSCNSYEYGNWSFSEHCVGGVLEHEWLESNTTHWHIDQYELLPFNHTYVYNNSNGSADAIGFTYLNNSGMNRSQTLVWIQNNGTAELPIYQGVIYAFRNASSFDTVLYGPNEIFFLTFNGTGFVNTNDSTPAPTPLEAYDYALVTQLGWYYDNETQEEEVWYYEIAPYLENGSWIKTIYNSLCGDIDTKAWGTPDFSGLFTEPSGWCYEGNLSSNATYQDCQGFGLCVWNFYEQRNISQFDFVEVWQLNYTLNYSAVHPVLEGRPHMEFPVINGSMLNDTLYDFFGEDDGNITYENISDFMQNITNLMNMESRPGYLYKPISRWDQNDTIYYYSAVISNFSDVMNQELALEYWGYIPENIIWLRIMDCTDANGTTGCMITFDVDNNGTWDDNDRAYYFGEPFNIEWEWHGDAPSLTYAPLSQVEYTWRNDLFNIHRYNSHVQYDFILPLNELVKNDSEVLNYSDVFGLSIFTWNAENTYVPFWQNYNESNCSAYKNEDHDVIKNYFINATYVDGEIPLTINETNIGLWGEGVITGALGDAGGFYDIEVNMTMYDNSTGEVINTVNSSMLGDNHSYEVNFTVNVSNTGTIALNDIYVNMTFLNCSCSDWKYNITSTNILEEDLYYYNDSCYLIIYDPDIEPLAAAANWSIWLVINISECDDTNQSGIIQNNVSVNGSSGVSSSDNSNPLQWRILVERVDVVGTRNIVPVQDISNNVINILGIVLILSAIFLVIFIMKQQGVI